MVIRPRPLSAALAILALCGTACAADGPAFDTGWSVDAVWDDGLAEVAIYDASRPIYGEDRPYRAVLLTVKEELDAGTAIKADPPYAGRSLVTVLKQNAVREIPTPNYDYRMMSSAFVQRDDPTRAVKLSSTSHEWCGNTWKSIRVRGGKAEHSWSSYFEGEGDGSERFTLAAGELFVDQLPLVLRGLPFAAGGEWPITLRVPTLATSRGGPLERTRATVRVVGREAVEVGGTAVDGWKVEVEGPGVGSRWWFDASGTHPLLRMDADDGNRMTLRSIERRAYWRLP